ncbi:hypothetical protein BpHYR1_001265 [Brachionus plicatilis]|uniref:Uncharacterized protein n=1 Tax=Brachionus plicatilis TaxID=10195 RepID=A0A3M7RD83_BRAPC|nr:hypothetical protein BpHYR1_001265 [Brachionus plicatilis]
MKPDSSFNVCGLSLTITSDDYFINVRIKAKNLAKKNNDDHSLMATDKWLDKTVRELDRFVLTEFNTNFMIMKLLLNINQIIL